jgi:hypothetical protein
MDFSPESIKLLGLLFVGGYYIEIGTMSIVEDRYWKWEFGSGKWECGSGKVSIADYGLRIAELQSIEQGIDESGPAVVR